MEMNLLLRTPSTIIITSGSSSGKTTLTEKLICKTSEVFDKRTEEIHWVYVNHAKDENRFSRIKKELDSQNIKIEFHEGFPETRINENTLFSQPKSSHKILVLDDIFTSPTNNRSLCDLFNIISHHSNGWLQ